MAYGDKNLVPKLQIESLQTVTPFKATEPRQTRRVLAADPVGLGIFRRCLNIVVYYKKVDEEDSGWLAAGWIKESLGRVLAEQPLLCGRLRRSEDGVGELEIVSNDSGVRLIEAKFPTTMSQFFDVHLKESSEDVEAELVFWKDIDDQSPQFSPLFYLQVTNFECGGYSVGISCNLLLADILIQENFFQKWDKMHKDMLSKNSSPKTPIFYLPHLKNASCNPAIPISSNQLVKSGQTMIFKVTHYDHENLSLEKESGKKLILARVEEVERELGSEMATKFPVYLKESSNVIKIEYCSKNVDKLVQSQLDFKSQVSKVISWDELGANEVDFGLGGKPDRVTYWIGSILDGVVVAIPSDSDESTTSGLNIIVSVPT